jgi:hypothetical protein
MADHVVLRRLLWAMTAICLVVALMAIPVVGDDGGDGDDAGGDAGRASMAADAEEGAGAEAGPSETPPPAAGSVPAADGATGASTAPGAAASAPTTLAPPDPALGAPTDPGPPVPPRAGRYRYRTTGGDEGGSESTTTVEDRGRDGETTRLSITTAGGQLTSVNDVEWRADGVRTLRSTLSFNGQQTDCDWEPDIVEAVYPLAPGATWSADSRCEIRGFTPTPIVLERTSRSKVVELRRAELAGTTVDVWVIERTERLSGGGRSEEGSAVVLFSPRHGIDVELRGTVSGREYVRQLVSLDPDAV